RVLVGIPPVEDELVDLVVRLGAEWLALVERQRPGERIAPRLDDIGDAVHRRRSLEGCRARPAIRGASRRVDGTLRVLPPALRDLADRLARGGRLGGEPLGG